jgi:excisionase family DNA binding protein
MNTNRGDTMTERMPLCVRPKEAARMLGISKPGVYKLIREGEIPMRKLGTATLIKVADIQAFVDRLEAKVA